MSMFDLITAVAGRGTMVVSMLLAIVSIIALIYVYHVPVSGSASSGTVTYYSAETKFMWATTNLVAINLILFNLLGYVAHHKGDLTKIFSE